MSEVSWGQYAEAYKALHDRLAEILAQLSTVKDPTKYLPVRLSDGSVFYNAGGGSGGGLVQSQVRNAADTDWVNEPFTRQVSVQNALDVIDNADRLLGRVYGSQGQQLKQRTATSELLIQVAHEGGEIDPRQVRALTSSDTVTAVQPTAANLQATVVQAAKDREVTDICKVASAWSVTASASGNTVTKTPSSGKKLRVKLVDAWNNGSADVTVCFRFGSSGTERFKKLLATKSGFAVNLVGCNWEGQADEALIVSLSAAGTVDVTVMGEEV